MNHLKKYFLYYVLLIALLYIFGYTYYAKRQIDKYKTCCDKKTEQAASLIINNAMLDSLVCAKDILFQPIVQKAKDLKNKSNAIKTMVIITEPDSIVTSLTRLSNPTNYKKQNK